ncbi:dTDP-glucose 4,6-dehydratase [Hahella sp. CCB-MM4]|nr:dTDP-glucose 4,6-dehydratase [Hahella sp. CCB-MM4]
MTRKIPIALTLLCVAANFAHAAEDISSYTSSLMELNDTDAQNKKIRLIYSVQSAWNRSHIPDGIKETKLILNGGSGFDMSNVPKIVTLNESGMTGYYRYSLPTAFQLKVGQQGGAQVTHIDHKPANTIETAQVSESMEFSLGISLETPSLGGEASWGTRVTYNQPEFRTVANYTQSNGGVTWDISNKTIRHNTPPKHWLMKGWLWCDVSNLIGYDQLPVVMKSDFRPEAAILYRKSDLNDGKDTTQLTLEANWRKTHYHFARDWCSWYADIYWNPQYTDYHTWTKASRTVSISWSDSLYH